MSGRSLLFWIGISLGAHLLLFALWPALRPLGSGSRPLPVELVAPSGGPSPSRVNDSSPRLSASPPSSAAIRPPQPAPLPLVPSTPAPGADPPRSAAPPVATLSSATGAEAPPAISPSGSAEAADDAVSGVRADDAAAAGQAEAAATAAEETQAITTGDLATVAPFYDHNPRPSYPRLAQERGWQGVVKVRVRVGVDGEVREVTLESSSGHAVLDRAALDGVRRWRFRPGRRGGNPVESEVVVPVVFQLERS